MKDQQRKSPSDQLERQSSQPNRRPGRQANRPGQERDAQKHQNPHRK